MNTIVDKTNGNGNGHRAVLEFRPSMTVELSPTGRRTDAWLTQPAPKVRLANWEHFGSSKRHTIIVESNPAERAHLISMIEGYELLGGDSFTIVPDETEASRLFHEDRSAYSVLIEQGGGMKFLMERLRGDVQRHDHLRRELKLIAA